MILALTILSTLTTLSSLTEAIACGTTGKAFDVSVTVITGIQPNTDDFAVEDSSGTALITTGTCSNVTAIYPGSKIHARGTLQKGKHGHIAAECSAIVQTGQTTPPPIQSISLHEFASGRWDSRLVRTTGVLYDYFIDEIDSKCTYLILNHGKDTIYAACYRQELDLNILEGWLGCEMSISGLCDPRPSGCRRKIGRILRFYGLNAIHVISPSPLDPFQAPTITPQNSSQPKDLTTFRRYQTSGLVLAVWHGDTLLIKASSGTISRVQLAKGPPPPVNACIDIVGIPETDLYRINFTRAIWRNSLITVCKDPSVTNVVANAKLFGGNEGSDINATFHGCAIRLRGPVRSLPSVGNDGRFYIESNRHK